MYEREIRFAVKKFKDLQLNILDKTFSVKVHALIGSTPVCRCCTLSPNKYITTFLSEKVEKFLRTDVIHPDLNKDNELYSDYFHDCAEGIFADTIFAVVNLFLLISDESSFEFSRAIRDISKNVCNFSLHHVITNDFFFISRERKFVYKKNHFSLTAAQQIEFVFVIYCFLKSYSEKNLSCSPIILCFKYLLQSFVNLHLYMTDITETTDEIIEKIEGIVDSIQVNIR
uniref:HEPN domain-containing protein n=1 Tax=Strongyloides papillosus TaxID=174720 RepID=A0A0N5BZN0_STREA